MRSWALLLGLVASPAGCALIDGASNLVEVECVGICDAGGDASDASAPPADARDGSLDATTPPTPDAGDGGSGGDGAPYGGEWPGEAGWGPDADYPYYATNYDEPYRGQYHFTAPNGWLSDVDGLWYYGGVFHLSYQAYPYTMAGLTKRWGHATSTDLVHWITAPVMLDPGVRNIPGDAWSGSAVVDTDDTSGLRTGNNPVIVAIYTATSEGTCLAYSNDLGLTWQPYAGNPLAIGGPSSDQRDPHVFWHEPTKQWVCAHYENGTAFFTSPDLLHWTKASSITFGGASPDMYELPVDGDATNTKWIVQDAAGQYLMGQFDGATFTPDPGGPYTMDVGTSFSASQTFYRPTFPDARVVQMAWMSSSTPQTAPWNQAISFPAELGLKTFAEGVRLTRTPIAEIASLYGATRHWGAETLAPGTNLLAGITSKTYDVELVVDVTRSKAKTIQFQLANESFTYDIVNAQLLGQALAPVSGQVTIRILGDWAELEVFGNGGELSYTASFGFTPSDSSLSITADAPLAIVSADFRQVQRAWPGQAALSSAQLDDADPSTTYTGSLRVFGGDQTYFDSTCHVTDGAGASVKATVSGTRVEWHGLKNGDLGNVEVSLDGTVVASNIDCYSPVRQTATLFSARGLANGPHTLLVTTTGTMNPASTGSALVHDFFASYVDP